MAFYAANDTGCPAVITFFKEPKTPEKTYDAPTSLAALVCGL